MRFKITILLTILLCLCSCTDNILEIYTTSAPNNTNPSSDYRMASYTRRFRDGSIMEQGRFSYNENGLVEKLVIDIYAGDTISSVLTISFGHDDNGLLSSRRHVNSKYTNEPMSFSYLYDENGQLERIRFLYRLSTSYPAENYSYMPDGKLHSYDCSRGTLQVSWDGNRIVQSEVDIYKSTYFYNERSQCVQKTYTTASRTGKLTYEYDNTGKLWKYNFYDDLGKAYTDTFIWETGKSDIDFTDIETNIKYDFGFGWF